MLDFSFKYHHKQAWKSILKWANLFNSHHVRWPRAKWAYTHGFTAKERGNDTWPTWVLWVIVWCVYFLYKIDQLNNMFMKSHTRRCCVLSDFLTSGDQMLQFLSFPLRMILKLTSELKKKSPLIRVQDHVYHFKCLIFTPNIFYKISGKKEIEIYKSLLLWRWRWS